MRKKEECGLKPTHTEERVIRDCVAKILQSAAFADSVRMTRFLSFAVDEALRGNIAGLKETVIGTEVFDRTPSYDPRLDPIVRVEARRLRSKLRQYYEAEGITDEVLIDLPKGGYAPVFHRREIVAQPAVGVTNDATIAVLPFANFSAEPDSCYFSDGMTEEIIHALMRIEGLRVVAWDSAAQMRDQQEDIGAIRRRLGVSHILRGSVRRDGQSLRISAQLIEAGTGQYLWSQTWDREFRDVFAIQAELAASIATTLKLHLLHSGEPGAVQPECYQLCLKGRFHARERTPDGLRRSIVCFERAVAMPDAPASAWAGLADAYSLCADYAVLAAAECIPKARTAAEKALQLDPLCAEAHAALGLILSKYDWRWEDAERELRRAIELNSGYATAHHWYAVDFLAFVGRFAEAMTEIDIALRLDPLSTIMLEGRAFLYTLSRRYDEAIENFRRLIELDPSFYKAFTSMGRAFLLKGNYAAAIAKLEEGRALAGDSPNILGALGEAHARSGNAGEARQLLARLHDIAGRRPVSSTSFALIHLGLGEKAEALSWLEAGVGKRELAVSALNVHPAYDELRGERRFKALLRRLKFPAVLR
jgi:TolB-like protein/Tfp pilus assembly protein PilF